MFEKFDEGGRRIPPEGLMADTYNLDRDFRLDHPRKEVYFANRIQQLHEYLDIDTGVTSENLKEETKRLVAIIKGNPQIANIVNGVYLPIIMPKLATDDLGDELELYLAGIGKRCRKTFTDRIFKNYREGDLKGKVGIIDESRHDQIISRMKKGSVVGLYFPNPLQGFSINADREQMQTLPEGFILSGMDTVIAMVMYLDILSGNFKTKTPKLHLSALSWKFLSGKFIDHSLVFGIYDGHLYFNSTDVIACADSRWSGSLLFVG